ncbi:MAG TPA: hypothetical protein IAA29_12665, partial [Candidatus Paenibacillus intestinavium]|nr:hypothetical protein [Candidatus Paenibacillus intestinavium]
YILLEKYLSNSRSYNMSLFNPDDDKKMALEKVTDALKLRYEDTCFIKAVSTTAAGQALWRAEMIGGHYK